MKVNVTCSGCEITVEEIDGKCTVVATQDGEVVEEFTVDCEGSDEEVSDEVEVDEVDGDNEGEELDSDDSDVEEYDEGDVDEEEYNESVKTFSNFFKAPAKAKKKK
tara:strand:- start:182 stop:499 length:318 start_codon:yes stop_codon:yes gene_type:complete